jgi:hypothetical protein
MRTGASILAAAALAACAPGNGNSLADGGGDKPPLPPVGPVSPPPPPPTPPGGDRCTTSMDYEHCVDFLPAERMHGVWLTGFEQSSYVANATAAPAIDDPERHRTWLTFASGAYPDPALRAELDKMGTTAAVAIEFDGRRSRGPGRGYGHLGGAENLVIVDRIVSMRVLGPLSRP